MRKSGSGCDETTECPLGTCARGVDQDAAAVDIASRSGPGKRANSLFQRTGWISAVQCDLGHQCVRDTVKKDIRGSRISRRFARKPFLPMAIAGQEFLVAMRRGLLLEPLPDRRFVKTDEYAFSKLLNRRQPFSVTGDRCAAPNRGPPIASRCLGGAPCRTRRQSGSVLRRFCVCTNLPGGATGRSLSSVSRTKVM